MTCHVAKTIGRGLLVLVLTMSSTVLDAIAQTQGLPESSRVEVERLEASYDSLYRHARYVEARDAIAQALVIQREHLAEDDIQIAINERSLGRALHGLADYSAADSVYALALDALRQRLGDENTEVATTVHYIAFLRMDEGKNEEAEPLMREALETRRALLGDADPAVALSLKDLGHLYLRKADYAESERLLREAIAIQRSADGVDPIDLAASLNDLGVVLITTGRFTEAEPLLREAIQIRREWVSDDHPDVAASIGNLAAVHYQSGNFAAAEPLFRRGLVMKRVTLPARHPSIAASLSNLSAVLLKQGNLLEAQALLEEALEILLASIGPQHPNIGLIRGNLGAIFRAQGDYERARISMTDALEIFRATLPPDHPYISMMLANIAGTLTEQGDYEMAEVYFREALEVYRGRSTTDPLYVASCLSNLAALSYRQADYSATEQLLEECLALYREMRSRTSRDAVAPMTLKGAMLLRSDRHADAAEVLVEAAEVFEYNRRRVGVQSLTRVAYSETASPYPLLALARLELGDETGAWEAAERDRARSLLDMLHTKDVRRLGPEESAEEKRLDTQLAQLEKAHVAFVTSGTEDAARSADSVRTLLLETQTAWLDFQSKISEKYPVEEGRPLSLETIQASLTTRSAIVGWLDVEDEGRRFVYLVPDRGPVVWKELSATPIDSVADQYRQVLASGPSSDHDLTRPAQAIYEATLGALQVELDALDIMHVIPSGPMVGIPVESLMIDEVTYVLDRWDVAYVPSATVFAWLRNHPPPASGRALLAVADPPFNEQQAADDARTQDRGGENAYRRALSGDRVALTQLEPLHASRQEVTEISTMFDVSEVLTGQDASEATIVELATDNRLADFSHIHIATHALVGDEAVERSSLILSQQDLPDPLEAVISGDRIIDGRLTMLEVLREWRLNASLVTLSACETALGQKVRGEGYIGFAHAFFNAGSRSVVVSLWRVEDQATRRLMVRFYDNMMEKGMTKSEALRRAKLWLRDMSARGDKQPYADPFFWSGFVLLGASN